jgi:hypothetical protein
VDVQLPPVALGERFELGGGHSTIMALDPPRLELMPSGLVNMTIGRAAGRVPGLRRVPMLKLLAAAEVALLARDHMLRLSPPERRRLMTLVAAGRGRTSRLTDAERDDLEHLLSKLEARLLLGHAVDRLSPVPLPRRLVYGPKNRR